MANSARLALPLIAAAQAQKHVTHNEALAILDAQVQASVINRTTTGAPVSPADGDSYIVASPATGTWAGQEDNLATWDGAAWLFVPPSPGMVVFDQDAGILVVFDAGAWGPLPASPDFSGRDVTAYTLGLGWASADATNRLSVNSPATLLNNAGSGHQLKINKAAAGDTASLLYQSGFSGRAEMGLAGTDDFSVKVSANGSDWFDAIAVDAASGAVAIGPGSAPVAGRQLGVNGGIDMLLEFGDRFVRGLRLEWNRGGGSDFLDWGYDTRDDTWVFQQFNTGTAWTRRPFRISISAPGVGDITFNPSESVEFSLPAKLASYTVATLPSASTAGAGAQVFVTDETGGAVPAFSDGTDWRRVTDRAVVS